MAHGICMRCYRHMGVRKPWPTFSLLQVSLALLGMHAVVMAGGGCGGDPVPSQAAVGDDPDNGHSHGCAARPSPAPAQHQKVCETTHPDSGEADVACAADEAASCSDADAASSTCRSPSSNPETCSATAPAAAGDQAAGQAEVGTLDAPGPAPAVVILVCPACQLTTCTETKCYGRCRKQGMVYCCCENRPDRGPCFCHGSGEQDGLREGRGGGAYSVGDVIDDAAVDYSSGYGYDYDQNEEQRSKGCEEGPATAQPAVHAASKYGVAAEVRQSDNKMTRSDPDVGAGDRTVLSKDGSATSGPVPPDADADSAAQAARETGEQLGESAAAVMRQITRCPRCRLTMCSTTRCFGLCRAQRRLFCCCTPRPGTPCRCFGTGLPDKGHGGGAYASGDVVEQADVDYTRGYDYDYYCDDGAE